MLEDAVLFTVMSTLIIILVGLLRILSWGLLTMGECLPSNYEPSCYSASRNDAIDTGDPLWFPHE